MYWRKWIVRGIVWGIITACGAGALAYQRWTNAAAVREQIIAKLSDAFPGAEVSVDSARLRILGGIQLNGLRLARKDDPEKREFLQVPSAIFYHDKEKILDGELTLRKIELIRPRLIARCGRNGKWNLQDLLRKPGDKPQAPMPAIVIHQGTLILVDQVDPEKTTVLEINDVGMTIINDPLPKVTIRGAAASELLGRLQLYGTLDRDRNEAFLSFKATKIALTQSLLARLPVQGLPTLLDGLKLSARANLEGKVWYHANEAQPLYYDVRCEVNDGKVEHPLLPLALEKLHGKLHCTDGTLELETLTACSAQTEVAVHGKAQLPRVDKEFEVHVDLKHVILGESLAKKLPEKIRALHQMFKPDGPTSIHIACAQHEGQWVALTSGKPSLVSLRPENIALKFQDFPYPLDRTTGSVDYNLLDKRVDIDLSAFASDRPVILRGHWTGEKDDADVDFNILADDVPINDKLLNALKTDGLMVLYTFSKSFHATGKVNVSAKIKHEPGHKYTNIFKLHFHETSICWDDFPYPLTNVSGTLEIYPTNWAIRQFQGWHGSSHVILNGQSTPNDKGESHGIKLEITGRNVALDDELHEGLRPMTGLYDAWATFRPQGNLFFTATVDRPSSDLRALKVKVNAQRASVKPAFFPYLIQDIGGDFWFHNNQLMIRNLRARHAQTLINVDNGEVDLNSHGAGGYYADFADLKVVGFQLDDDFIQAIPSEKLRKAAQTIQLTCLPDSPPVRFLTRLVIKQAPESGKPPEVFWDGRLWVNNARVSTGIEFNKVTGEIACRGLTNGPQIVGLQGNALLDQAVLYNQPFKKVVDKQSGNVVDMVHASFVMLEKSPDLLEVNLHAPIFGGDVTGQVKIQFNSTLSYKVNLTASRINLAEFGQRNVGPKSQLSGPAEGRLVLSGWGTSADTIEGEGELNIPRGSHIYNLPFLLEFLNSLGLNRSERTTFEEFHTAFDIQSTKVHLKKVDLLGNTLSLAGKGDFDLVSKDLKLDVFPMWGRVEQLFPKEMQQWPRVFSKNLLMVEVRGKVSTDANDLKFHIKPLPIVLGPVQSMRDLLNSKSGVGTPALEPRNPDPILDVPVRR